MVRIIILLIAIAHYSSVFANDDEKFAGDKLSFPVQITGNLDTDGGEAICIPMGTPLRGLGDLTSQSLTVKLANIFGDPKDCSGSKAIPSDRKIFIPRNVVKDSAPSRYGLTYGGLVVPFKYFPGGTKEFTAGGTVAPYLGYRFDKNDRGLGLKLVGFLGGAGVRVQQNVEGESKAQTLAGLSYGIGTIGQVKGELQVGLIIGADRVSKSAGYENNGKWWLALGIGFSFTE